jgi:hypothetical protein
LCVVVYVREGGGESALRADLCVFVCDGVVYVRIFQVQFARPSTNIRTTVWKRTASWAIALDGEVLDLHDACIRGGGGGCESRWGWVPLD